MPRPKGSINKRSQTVIEALTYDGWCPLAEMKRIAMDESYDISVRMDALKSLAPYVAPKLKAVDHTSISSNSEKPLVINFQN